MPSTNPRWSAFQARLSSFGGRTALLVIGLGLVVIALGYNGIAGATINGFPVVQAQLPYLISGGVFGISLVIIGAALMVTQSVREDRVRLEAKLDQLIEIQQQDVAPRRAAAAPVDVEGLFAAGSSSFHRPTCRLVQGREGTRYVTADEAGTMKLKGCRVCQPEFPAVDVLTR